MYDSLSKQTSKEILTHSNDSQHIRIMDPVNISICNQKGGIGKSTFTVLIASYLHYTLGHDVLVVDCDYPQWSILAPGTGAHLRP